MNPIETILHARAAARTSAEHAVIAEATEVELGLLRVDAEVALDNPHADQRGALLRYIVGNATLHGRTTGEQIAHFIATGDRWFADLALVAWGTAL
ncbi:MAG: hypothetical protein KDC98_08180 [Planctomycetes bacterium]|nr:hypothetical protein [Planctomycetota bacterium]